MNEKYSYEEFKIEAVKPVERGQRKSHTSWHCNWSLHVGIKQYAPTSSNIEAHSDSEAEIRQLLKKRRVIDKRNMLKLS